MNVWMKERWELLNKGQFKGFLAGFCVFLLLVFKSEPGFVLLLDHANLLFHEAGHPFYGIFSARLTPYGGTLGQLTFPAVLAISFWRKGESISFAASIIWFFENGLNISRYMADARAQVLPLVGGGEHDWAYIFGKWGVTTFDTRIAGCVRMISWTGIVVAALWILWLWWATAKERSENKAKEDEARINSILREI
jgi:hypothetical protein